MGAPRASAQKRKRMSASNVPIPRAPALEKRNGAPFMGEHSDEILTEDLALTADQLQQLRSTGVVS